MASPTKLNLRVCILLFYFTTISVTRFPQESCNGILLLISTSKCGTIETTLYGFSLATKIKDSWSNSSNYKFHFHLITFLENKYFMIVIHGSCLKYVYLNNMAFSTYVQPVLPFYYCKDCFHHS